MASFTGPSRISHAFRVPGTDFPRFLPCPREGGPGGLPSWEKSGHFGLRKFSHVPTRNAQQTMSRKRMIVFSQKVLLRVARCPSACFKNFYVRGAHEARGCPPFPHVNLDVVPGDICKIHLGSRGRQISQVSTFFPQIFRCWL